MSRALNYITLVLMNIGVSAATCSLVTAASIGNPHVGNIEETLTMLDYTAIQIFANNNGCTAQYAYRRAEELLQARQHNGK